MSSQSVHISNLEQSLSALYNYVSDADKMNQQVSSATIGWHIEHTLLVIKTIGESVIKSKPNNYKWKFNFARLLVFTLNRFPRGKGKAPDIVNPQHTGRIDFDELFTKTRQAIEDLKKAEPNQYFKHTIFGLLNRKNTFTMLDIHTRHHLLIIKDILSRS